MRARATPLLGLAVALGLGGLAAALVVGDAAPAVLAAPFAVTAAAALLAPAPTVDGIRLHADRDRLVVGQRVTLSVEVQGRGLDWVEVRVVPPPQLTAVGGPDRLVPAGQPVALELEARTWGGGPACAVEVRGRGLLGLRTVTGSVRLGHAIRVHPTPAALRAVVPPRRLAVVGGPHPARQAGDGTDYAESRAFTPGDRLRDVNWRMTARTGERWVDQRHPERSGSVVLFVDSFASSGLDRDHTLALAVEAGTALARAHLAGQDRVGLVDLGGTLRWLPTGTGATHRHRLVEALVDAEVVESWAAKDLDVIPAAALPPRSLVIALTPLADPRTVAALLQLRGRRHDVAVVESAAPAPARPPADAVEDLGRRLWALEHDTVRAGLRRAGADLVTWRADEPLGPRLEALVSARRRPRRVGA